MPFVNQMIKLMRRSIILAFFTIAVVILVENSYRSTNFYILRIPASTYKNALGVQSRVDKTTHTRAIPFPTILKEEKQSEKHHLLINAYMNSGSGFTGSLFGFRKEAFYFYEPLWRASIWDFFKAPNLVCSSVLDICQNMTAAYFNKLIRVVPHEVVGNESLSDLLLGVLEQVYGCDFTKLEVMVVPSIACVPALSGPSWDPYRRCIIQNKTNIDCIKKEEDLCRRSPHIITKVLRMTAGSLEPLLWSFQNLKIIQLFRDPRAIINSRINSKYPLKDNNTKALCRKMTWDLREGMELVKKYPDRVKFVFYEDIKSDVLSKTEYLSNFIGMEFNRSEVSLIDQVRVNKPYNDREILIPNTRAVDNANWWKSTLPENILKSIQEECREFLDTFGFELYKSKADLFNSARKIITKS